MASWKDTNHRLYLEEKPTDSESETAKSDKESSNSLYADFKAKQKEYKQKTALNSFRMVKEDKRSRKERESDTMAMLSGFKGALFNAKNPKKAKQVQEESEKKEKRGEPTH